MTERLAAYITARNQGITLVADCVDATLRDLLAMNMSVSDARELLQLRDVYFGSSKFTKMQREAREHCVRMGHGIAVLLRIERYVRRARDQRAGWKLRQALCASEEKDLQQVATRVLAEVGRRPEVREGIQVVRRKSGVWTLRCTAKSDAIADLAAMVSGEDSVERLSAVLGALHAQPASESDTSLDVSSDALATTVGSQPSYVGQLQAPVTQTNVVITLDQLEQVIAGEGDEVQVRLGNGAVISGAQLVQRRLAQAGLITLVDPVAGPVNLYRSSRFASAKQRDMLAAEFAGCVWPDCNAPIDECQWHHVKSWRSGGPTNLQNLVPLCAYHNGINDDDGAGGRRGRIIRRGRAAVWLPPWAEKLPRAEEPPPDNTS